MVPYARLSIDLTVDLTEGPDHWSIGWTNYLYYLQGDLKPYLDRFCPYPEEVWLEIWSHLRSVVRQADFDQPQGTSRAAA